MVRTERNQKLRDSVILAIFASLMFASKILMELLPNIHLLGMFIVLLTVVYRASSGRPSEEVSSELSAELSARLSTELVSAGASV